MLNFLCLSFLAVTVFGVPVKGSFFTLSLAVFMFCVISTGMGLLASTITNSQIAAMFFAMVGTLVPSMQFAGLLNPVSSMEGVARFVGEIYPATHMFLISRGVFNKALALQDVTGSLWAMMWSIPVIIGLAIFLLKKQER